MRTLYAREVAELPPLTATEEITTARVSSRGDIAILTTARGEMPIDGGPARTRAHLRDGSGAWRAVTLDPAVAVAYSHLDLLPAGEVLLVRARCDVGVEDNAHVFDRDGVHLRSFSLGDGIAHVGVDHDGLVWVGYFDEGVFGDGVFDDGQPVGEPGLLRFSTNGELLWKYTAPAGAEPMADCYALNVDAHTTWTCYHPDHPLVEITGELVRSHGYAPVRSPAAVAIHERDVVFVGDYEDPLRVTCCLRTTEGIEYDDVATLIAPDGTALLLFHLLGARGSRLYLRTDRRILVVDLSDDLNRARGRR